MKLYNTHHPDQKFGERWDVYSSSLERSSTAHWARDSAAEMINLLARLEAEIKNDGTWYGYTSHFTLCLNRTPITKPLVWVSPTGDGKGLAKINGLAKEDTGCFRIGYRIPDSESPWPEAEVQMRANSVTDCLAALEVAFKRCG
jgi:hypothetical protein